MAGTTPHTPDPTQGALIDVAGVIVLPNDLAPLDADAILLGDQQLADWIAYLKALACRRGIKTLSSGPATETVLYTDATAWGPSSPSADIVAELDKASVPTGARIRVGRTDAGMSGRTLAVNNGVGGPQIALIGAGAIGWCEAEFNGTNWVVTAWGGTITV